MGFFGTEPYASSLLRSRTHTAVLTSLYIHREPEVHPGR